MPFEEDLDSFFDPNDFGTTATYTPLNGTATSINGIYEARYYSPLHMSGEKTLFMCKTSDTTSALNGTLVINGTTYKIVEVEPDGTGVSLLHLQEQ